MVSWPATIRVYSLGDQLTRPHDLAGLTIPSMHENAQNVCRRRTFLPPLRGDIGDYLCQRTELLRKPEIADRFVGENPKRWRDLRRIFSKYRREHDVQDHTANVACYIDTLFFAGAPLPFLHQRIIGGRDDVGKRVNCNAVERGLNNTPLTFPKFAFARHKAVSEEHTDPFDSHALAVVTPILAKNMLCILGGANNVDVGVVDMRFIDVSEALEAVTHPTQEILRWVVSFDGSRRYPTIADFHFVALPAKRNNFLDSEIDQFGIAMVDGVERHRSSVISRL